MTHLYQPRGTSSNKALIALTDVDIERNAPSVFTDHKMPGASNRYQFVRTIDVINSMRSEGFEVVSAYQSAARAEGGGAYTKHVLRLIHRDYIGGKLAVGDVVPESAITNSHNRTSSFQLMAALKVLACGNGMLCPVAEYGDIRVLHNDPKIHQHIIDGTNLIREISENHGLKTVEKMKTIELSKEQAIEFAIGATVLKWGVRKDEHAESLLEVRRAEDDGNTVWQVLNRVQENAMRGGYQAKDKAGRNVTVAGINSVARDLDFNSRLWTFGTKVLQLV